MKRTIVFKLLTLILCLGIAACQTSFHGTRYDIPSGVATRSDSSRPLRILMVRRGYLDELRDMLVLRGHTVDSAANFSPEAASGYDAVILLADRKYDSKADPNPVEWVLIALTIGTLTLFPGIEYSKGYQHKIVAAFPRKRRQFRMEFGVSRTRIYGVWAPLLGFLRDRRSSHASASASLHRKIIGVIEANAQ